ncbi:hypothetical protein [Gottfriedia solisilvae]|uniref:Uncharacterized protein n=1 Tax=Gottfriedia solisilvae TaxID=1516104 RepID=A0A8J3AI75_9BACI|nr:hypothetical protein [Gottfriedia solisilvae]GGI13305.1 hypothetical protein GCM10007380_17250 [Gottfriedia solisilvae]
MEKNWFTDKELEDYSNQGILSDKVVKELRELREKDKKKKSSKSP